MRTSQKTFTTNTTLAGTKSQIASSRSIVRQASGVIQRKHETRSPQRTVSIIEEARGKKKFERQSTETQIRQGTTLRVSHVVEITQNQTTIDLQIVRALEKIFFKKKRYCFQVLKQFYLFPDETQSDIRSLSEYDPLVFQEEIIHSLVKIMETRVITNKIWGFLNLKMMPYLKAAIKIQQKVTQIQEKTIKLNKKYSFEMIKVAAQEAISAIKKPDVIKESRCLQINTSYLQNENKQIQCGIEQKEKMKKTALKSNIIEQQVRPSIVDKKEAKGICESSTRVYTRQEYELKYGKMKERNENVEPKIIRISSPDYQDRKKTLSSIQTNVYTSQTQVRVPSSKIIYTEQRPEPDHTKTKQETKFRSEIMSPRKYNIIHYHERPKQKTFYTSLHDIKTQNRMLNSHNTSCSSHNICPPCISTCCCQPCKCLAQVRSTCCINTSISNHQHFYQKYQKNDAFNQTKVTDHFKFINEPKSSKIVTTSLAPQTQLSELQSRIQYLNFLKTLVKQQELQESLSKQ